MKGWLWNRGLHPLTDYGSNGFIWRISSFSWSFLSKLRYSGSVCKFDCMLYCYALTKPEAWVAPWSLLPLRLRFISISTIRPWKNNIFMNGLELLIAIWIWWISYIKEYVGLLVQHLLLLVNFGSLSKCSQLKSSLYSLL